MTSVKPVQVKVFRLTMVFTVSVLLFWVGTTQAQQAAVPAQMAYERSAPSAIAAKYAKTKAPSLAAAHALQLTSQLSKRLDDTQIRNLQIYGPWLSIDGLSDNAQTLIRWIQNSKTHGLNPQAYQLGTILELVDNLLHLDRGLDGSLVASSDTSILDNSDNATTTARVTSAVTGVSASINANQSDSTLVITGNLRSLQNQSFDSKALADQNDSATALQTSNNSNTSDDFRKNLSNQLDRAFLKLSRHIGQGVVNGRELQSRLYRDAPRVKPESWLEDIREGKTSVSELFDSISQQHPTYLRMTQRMRDLLTEQASGVERTTVAPVTPTDDITAAQDNSALRQRLFETGDLSIDDLFNSYDPADLKIAIQNFQTRHGVASSGIADTRTRRTLNRSVNQEIAAMALNLERWRWLPRDFGDKHIFVNIPEYRMQFYNDGITELSMHAVVGKRKHQTPSFSQDMSYMDFNPTWTVPASITNEKLIPKERNRPGYLDSRQFEYLQRIDNQLIRVPRNQVTAKDFQQEKFPYILRQRGGPWNALGNMKFMMPNPYAIYLHDTQVKEHFTLNDRAFSHGCIRLSEPESLARLLLKTDGKDPDIMQSALDSGQTTRIRLFDPIPTHLVYLTTWVDENNKTQYRDDLYFNNQRLHTALKAKNTLITLLDEVPDRKS